MPTFPATPSPAPTTFDGIVSTLVRALRATPDTARYLPRRPHGDGPSSRTSRAPSSREIYGCPPCAWGDDSETASDIQPESTPEAWSVSPSWSASAVLSKDG